MLLPQSKISAANSNFTASSFINKTFSPRHTNKTGLLLTGMKYDLLLNKSFAANTPPQEIVNSNGFSTLLSAYSHSAVNISHKLVMTAGINSQLFTLNHQYTIEPRLGFRYQLQSNHSLGVAYGLHSRLENLNYYLNNNLNTGEKAVNKNVDFTKAHHLVLGYDWNITDLIHLKVAPYYQQSSR